MQSDSIKERGTDVMSISDKIRKYSFIFMPRWHIPFLKNKYLCLQGKFTGKHLFKFEIYGKWRRKDHAGYDINLEICGYEFYLEITDGRHWNYVEDRFYMDDEPQCGWSSPEKYYEDIKKFIANHPEIDKGYYRRCLIAYKLYNQIRPWDGMAITFEEFGEMVRKFADDSGLMFKHYLNPGGWHEISKMYADEINAQFSEEKLIAEFITYKKPEDGSFCFRSFIIDEREDFSRKGGIIILPEEKSGHKYKSRQIGRIITWLKNRLKPINQGLRHENIIMEILSKRKEIKCFSLGYFFSGMYFSPVKPRRYNCGSLCIEILNADSELLCKIAEELCAVMNKPEILLKDYKTDRFRRFER